MPAYRVTPDGRYLLVRGRLWRSTNPELSEDDRDELVRRLMRARRQIMKAKRSGSLAMARHARRQVHKAKVALGERGPVWWNDGTPDYNRRLAVNTPYRDWFLEADDASRVAATAARRTRA
jgi:hypothetical protein